jgi:hypothetical protein
VGEHTAESVTEKHVRPCPRPLHSPPADETCWSRGGWDGFVLATAEYMASRGGDLARGEEEIGETSKIVSRETMENRARSTGLGNRVNKGEQIIQRQDLPSPP